jgi:hypothetical protein
VQPPTRRRSRAVQPLRLLAAALAAALLAAPAQPAGAAAQEALLHGRLLDPAGAPVPGHPVLLHVVDDRGGDEAGRTATDEQGRFAIPLAAPADTGAIYFVATRYQGGLYVGHPVRPPFGGEEYLLVIGPETDASAFAMPGQPPTGPLPADHPPIPGAAGAGDDWNWGVIVLLAVFLGAFGALLWYLSRRSSGSRAAVLAELAELDEAFAGRQEQVDREEWTGYLEERADLLERLDAARG